MQSTKKTNVKETNFFGKTFARLKQMRYLCNRNQEQMQNETSKRQTALIHRQGTGTLDRAQHKRG